MEFTIEQLAAKLGTTVEAYNALRIKAAQKAKRDLGMDVTVDNIIGPFPASMAPPSSRTGMFLRLTPQKGNWAWAKLLPNGSWRRFATKLDRAIVKGNLTYKRPSRKQLVWCGFDKPQG